MVIKLALVSCCFITLLYSIATSAFETNGPGWSAGQAPFHTTPISVTGSDGLTSAQLRSAFEAAMDLWSDNSAFNYVKDSSSITGINICPTMAEVSLTPANNDNGYGFASTPCSGIFQGSTIAVATSWRSGSTGEGPLLQSGIIFKSSANWDIYTGPQGFNTSLDFTRVASHELGHSLGLAHTDDDQALMWPTSGDVEAPNNDDFDGVEFLYGIYDTDSDGVAQHYDNCPDVSNPDQADLNDNGLGDACDNSDNDSSLDDVDNCPLTDNEDQAETGFGVGAGDACDLDDDGARDAVDNCPFDDNQDQANLDGDSFGDDCDNDADGDGAVNGANDSDDFDALICSDTDNDQCDDCSSGTFDPNDDGVDSDNDGICNKGEVDDDNDGVNDDVPDNCPMTHNPGQADSNNDGVGDACDDDELCFPIRTTDNQFTVICI